jgi:hypothetical protein
VPWDDDEALGGRYQGAWDQERKPRNLKSKSLMGVVSGGESTRYDLLRLRMLSGRGVGTGSASTAGKLSGGSGSGYQGWTFPLTVASGLVSATHALGIGKVTCRYPREERSRAEQCTAVQSGVMKGQISGR